MRRFTLSLALTATVALALGACASGKDTGLPAAPTSPPAGAVCTQVKMTDQLKFEPEDCTIKPGTQLVWVNSGSLPHTVTSVNGVFDSGDAAHPLSGGAMFKFTFKTAGTFAYYCRLHSADKVTGMVGKIIVQA